MQKAFVRVFSHPHATADDCHNSADQASQGLQHRSNVTTTQRAPEANAPPPQALHRPRRQQRGLLGQLFQIPILIVGAGIKIVCEVVKFGYQCTTTVGSRVLPRSVTRTLQGEKLAPHNGATACMARRCHSSYVSLHQLHAFSEALSRSLICDVKSVLNTLHCELIRYRSSL